MVIPWIGYSLSELIKQVEPTGNAKYVEFVTLADPKQMPGVALARARLAVCRRPAHGRGDASADAADLRHVRRGAAEPERRAGAHRACRGSTASRAAKSIVKIRFVEKRAAHGLEQGRGATNTASIRTSIPNVDHPRWTQATERRIGEDGLFAKKRKTLMFNGYERGRAAVRRHGPEEELSDARPRCSAPSAAAAPARPSRCSSPLRLLPFAWLLYGALRPTRSGANPAES